MAKAKKFDLEDPAPILDEEDDETLAAIDEGVQDAKAGRMVPAAKAREFLTTWVSYRPHRGRPAPPCPSTRPC